MFKRFVYIEGFTNLVDSGNHFAIDVSGNVINSKGLSVPSKTNAEGDLVVTVISWDGYREYRVIDLVALVFKDLRIPKEQYCKVVAFVIDGNKQNTHASNVGYRFTDPIEVPDFPGFYYILNKIRLI